MQAELFREPQRLNMGFHYTAQFSRRTRVNVMGLVEQGSDEWVRWYAKTHARPAVQAMADAGYTLIEIHFLYGFGLEGEREEWERTRTMVANAHAVGLKVLGYFQFQSVQQETFFLENPWARDCVQIDAHGQRIEYRYDRPALCFSEPRVQQYYLDGVTLGLTECGLDGIRLDNDYYKGCYCPRCQAAFGEYLRAAFPEERARRVFGLKTTAGMSLAPRQLPRDPLWMATVRFRQAHRQAMLRRISRRILEVKPDAVLGGNPAVGRRYDDPARIHVHVPDLGETHHLVCAENQRFPARTGETIRYQALLYKYGQSNRFAVFASHHPKAPDGLPRWPDSVEECALSLCEALAFGGHPVCTTWGIRMDGTEDKTVYQRPLFRQAFDPVAAFLKAQAGIYRDAVCDARTGVYQNRESLCFDTPNAWLSMQGAVQALLQNQVPFRLVDRDEDGLCAGLDLLIVPDVQWVSDEQVTRFKEYVAGGGRLLCTGNPCRYDEWRVPREREALDSLWAHPRVRCLGGTPEKIAFATEEDYGRFVGEAGGVWYRDLPPAPGEAEFIEAVKDLLPPPQIEVRGSRFVTVETFRRPDGRRFVHLLNYDNRAPCDVAVTLQNAGAVTCVMPEGLGTAAAPEIRVDDGSTAVTLRALHTYCVIATGME